MILFVFLHLEVEERRRKEEERKNEGGEADSALGLSRISTEQALRRKSFTFFSPLERQMPRGKTEKKSKKKKKKRKANRRDQKDRREEGKERRRTRKEENLQTAHSE